MSLYKKMKTENARGNKGVFSLVSRMVYLHEMYEEDVEIIKSYDDAKYVYIVSRDMLAHGHAILPTNFGHSRKYFNDDIYSEMQRLLMPSVNSLENVQPIYYSQVQQKLIVSSPVRRVIKGVVGSGKTLVLAQRAVNAYLRTQQPVLILTFNITMCNYIHDRLSAVRGLTRWNNFRIQHYHGFITEECNRFGITLPRADEADEVKSDFYRNLDLFAGQHIMCRYAAIFIDEGQDYEYNWMKIIEMYFLAKGGEFVIFGDEKQNIYGRPLENKRIRTPITGRPQMLRESYRLSGKTIMLANDFQKDFLANRYDLDHIPVQQTLENPYLLYTYIREMTLSFGMDALFQFLFNEKGIHPNDIFVIGTTRKSVQMVFSILSVVLGIPCDLTVLTDEEERNLERQVRETNRALHGYAIQRKIREEKKREERPKKQNFWMNSGRVKLTTIQSMKGWESHTVVLLIERNGDGNIQLDETIYSGITRGKSNMVIINIENDKYDKFFMKECMEGIMIHWNIQNQR